MPEQEVFDKVATHLRKQGYKRSITEDGCCAYYGENGMRCAVGCLIPDELYSETLEGRSATAVGCVLTAEEWPPAAHQELLDDLQATHDNMHIIDPEAGLARVAEHHGLTYTNP